MNVVNYIGGEIVFKSIISNIAMIMLILLGGQAYASVAATGKPTDLSHRGGYLMFKVIKDDGTNFCSSCPTDPGKFGSGRCWLPDADKTKITMLMTAYTLGKNVRPRMSGASSCDVYEMRIVD